MKDINIEFESFTDDQMNTFHNNQQGNDIYSICIPRDIDFMWSIPGVKEMKFLKDTQDENCEYIGTYHASNQFDILKAVFLKILLPHIKVKDEYLDEIKICWTKNISHNLINSCDVVCSEYNDSSINSKWLDMNELYLVHNKDFYLHLIGDMPELTDWTDELSQN